MDIDHFAVHDGPGIRTAVFLSGCPLRCQWCHSPESQKTGAQLLYAQSRCVNCGACASRCPYHLHTIENGEHVFRREGCTACGLCTRICPTGALSLSARKMSVGELAAELTEDEVFYHNSGGGVTFSGGEVLCQAGFVRSALKEIKRSRIHTVVETSGYGKTEELLSLTDYVDVFYYDFKLHSREKFQAYVGGDGGVPLRNLVELRKKTDGIVLRIPLIPDITDTMENIEAAYATAKELNISRVHLLPYNVSASAKYEWIGRDWVLGELTPDKEYYEVLKAAAPGGIEVTIQY